MENKNTYENLKKMRASFWFSQEQIAKYLNINRSAVALMESGKRKVKYEELKKLSKLYDITIDSLENSIDLTHIKNDTLNIKKFENVLLYILGKCWAKPNIWKTMIYKLLYFVDFKFIEDNWKYITWIKYVKFPRWPVPYNFDLHIQKMIDEQLVTQFSTVYCWYLQYKLIPNVDFEKNSLSQKEILHIDNIIDKYSDMSATEISEASHNEFPWLVTKNMCEIKFDLAKK